jgi:hypothetical protein
MRHLMAIDSMFKSFLRACFVVAVVAAPPTCRCSAAELLAGAAKVDITNTEAGPVDGRLYAKALVVSDGSTKVALVTVDAVAIGEIGHIGNEYLGNVREKVEQELGIEPQNVLINASHCHGVVCKDVEERTIQAIREAAGNLTSVTVGAGTGYEDRIMENRRLKLTSGKEIDVRHAYSMPPDVEVAEVGPVDPEIGVLRLDREDGRTLAVVYNFACHPIQGVPSGANTSDMTGFASQVIEDNLSEDTVALFVQGCAGDINPTFYKDVDHPRSAQPLGNMLGLSTLKAVRNIKTRPDSRLRVINEQMELPRADLSERIALMEQRQSDLLQSLRGTSLSLKTFIPLVVKYKLSADFPSYYSHRYLHDRRMGRDDLEKLDSENRRNMDLYIRNIHTMETLTRMNTNLSLLRKHQARNVAAGKRTITVELVTLRIGDFVLTTFPGELTVQIGLSLKENSPHDLTFVAGYTNGYIYYSPTAEQLRNVGGAQEDSDCLLAPQWHGLYEAKATELLQKL